MLIICPHQEDCNAASALVHSLCVCLQHNDLIICCCLKQVQQHINFPGELGKHGNLVTALIVLAMKSGDVEIAKLLLKHGADGMLQATGQTAFQTAIRHGNTGLAKLIMEAAKQRSHDDAHRLVQVRPMVV